MKLISRFGLSAFLLGVGLSSCELIDSGPVVEDVVEPDPIVEALVTYFPLGVGHQWTYIYDGSSIDGTISSYGPATNDIVGTLTWVVDTMVETDRGVDFTIVETVDATVHYVYPGSGDSTVVGVDTTYSIRVVTRRRGARIDGMLEIEPVTIGARDTNRMLDNPVVYHRYVGGRLDSLSWQYPISTPDTVGFEHFSQGFGSFTVVKAQLVRGIGIVDYSYSRGPIQRSGFSERMKLVSFSPAQAGG